VEGCRKGRTIGVGTVDLWTGPRPSRAKVRSTSAISASAPHRQQSPAFVTPLYSHRLVLGIPPWSEVRLCGMSVHSAY
jgi:hypothetical protein